MRRRKGFTLIELLIVVAIIAILALIAVPNFLEAQTRAKVARAKNDLRTLAVGVESYHVDASDWPFGPNAGPAPNWATYLGNWPSEYGQWFHLTTPISYLSSVPHDCFFRLYNEQWGIWRDYYRVWNLSRTFQLNSGWGRPSTYNASKNGVQILMASVGPDRVEDVADGTAGGFGNAGGQTGMVIYDPTNGTVSWGDIYYGLPGIGFENMQQKIVP
jgi:prepilin-type N-terminal cleavage/methylation domain-containing protein